MALTFTDANFKETVLESDKLAVVDFWAVWCGPCRAIAPMIDEMATKYDGQVSIGKVNVDENPQVALNYGVRNIPTILFIKDGEVVHKQVGALPKSALDKKIQELMAN